MFSEAGLKQLKSWGGMTPQLAEACGIFEVEDASTVVSNAPHVPGLAIPYVDQSLPGWSSGRSQSQLFIRIRILQRGAWSGGGRKYVQQSGTAPQVYLPPIIDWRQERDFLLITEGEAKAVMATAAGFPTAGIGGVFNWAQRNGELLPTLADVVGLAKHVYVVFDSDRLTNPNIMLAETRLLECLTRCDVKAYAVALPPRGDDKEALDTYLEANGPAALAQVLERTPHLSTLERRILAMNQELAWLEEEERAWDLQDLQYRRKDVLLSGSRHSTETVTVLSGKQRTEPKPVQVVKAWLTSAHARRYSKLLFRPGGDEIIRDPNGRPALNRFRGWNATHGANEYDKRIATWLELTRYLFRSLHAQPGMEDFAVKLLAYKAQHPMAKVGLSFVLVNPNQGSGKSLWGECVMKAFAPWAVSIGSREFIQPFHNWLDRTVWCNVNEADPEDMKKAMAVLKSLITDKDARLNEKYLPTRDVQSYTMYCLSSNQHAIGSVARDDRRLIVVDVPDPDMSAHAANRNRYLGEMKGTWVAEGGPAALMGYLLDYDLEGWQPPERAPGTYEKYSAYREGLTDTQQLAEEMFTADESRVFQWLAATEAYCQSAVKNGGRNTPRYEAFLRELLNYRVSDWYTAEELVKIFPSVAESLNYQAVKNHVSVPGLLSTELRDCGIKVLRSSDDMRGFRYGGLLHQFLIVANFDKWRHPISQQEFEQQMAQWPTYGAICARR